MSVPPPAAASAVTLPPCWTATWRTIARPSPEPGLAARLGAAVEAVEDVRQILGGDPGPWSRTVEPPAVQAHLHGLARWAVLDRVVDQVADGSLQARGHAGDERRLELQSSSGVAGVRRRARSATSLTSTSRRTSSASARGSSPRARSIRSFISSVSSSICSTTSPSSRRLLLRVHLRSLLLQDLDVRAQAGDGRAQLVRGVGHELALRVHGRVERAHGVLERVEHRVEAAGEAPELVFPGGLDAPAEILRQGDVLGGLGEALERLHRRARHEPPEQRGEGDAADDEQDEDQAQPAEQAVDFGERLGELDGVAATERLGEQAQVGPFHVSVAQKRFAAAFCQRQRARVDRERESFRGAFDDLAAAVHHLLVAAHLIGSRWQPAEDAARARARARAVALHARGARGRR